jgi:hypothetical protein
MIAAVGWTHFFSLAFLLSMPSLIVLAFIPRRIS